MSPAPTLPPPTGPAAPPPPMCPPPAPPVPTSPPVLTARWLGLLGGGLVAVASLIVGFGGRELLGAYGPAAGLAGAAAASWFASTRMRTTAPVVATVLAHLARLVAAIAAAAVVAGSTTWAAVPAAAGLATAAVSFGWQLGGRWARAALHAVAVGGVAMSVAAVTVAPLGVLLAAAGAIAMVGLPTRRGGRRFADAGGVLAALALLAPVGGLPGRWRLGPGTLARLGLRGDVLDWAAPAAAVVAGCVLLTLAGRRRSIVLARLAVAASAANIAIGLGWDGWEPVRPVAYLALTFAAVQVALACAHASDPFWTRALAPITPVVVVGGWVLAIEVTLEVVGVTLIDGVERSLAVAPALVAIGFAVGRFDRLGRAPFVITATAMTLLAVFAATGSATATAASAVAAAACFVTSRSTAVVTLTTASSAAVLTFLAQLVDESLVPDGLAVLLIAVCVLAIGADAPERVVLPLGAAVVFGAAVDVTSMLEGMITFSGITATVLVATRRTTTLGGAATPALLGFVALGGLVDVGTRGVDGASLTLAIAATSLVSVGLAGWWRGERWARHLAAAAAVVAAGCWACAAGAGATDVALAVLVGGVAAGGAAFTHRRFAVADAASLAALAWATVYGFAGDDPTIGWSAMTALGIAIGLQGLCFIDFTVAGAGAGVALFGALGLARDLDAATRIGDALRGVGVSGRDIAMFVIVVALAAGGVIMSVVDPRSSSWVTWGPSSATAGCYLLGTIAINDAPDTRLVVTLTAAIALVIAGALMRSAAPLVLGTATVVGAVMLASWTTLRSLPGWVWIGASGIVLLTTGALIERRGHGDADEEEHATVRRILESFR